MKHNIKKQQTALKSILVRDKDLNQLSEQKQ